MRRLLRFLPLMILACVSLTSRAHEMTMAEMEVREVAPHEFLWQWTATERRGRADLVPQWPEGCTEEGSMVRCGPAGLRGRFAMEGVGKRYSAAIVKLYWQDGGARVVTLTAEQPAVELFGSAEDRRGYAEVARAYFVLGVEHILTGYDHLMFVFGLLFLVGFNRRLVGTITAFTLAHSITLASSALGWLTLRSPPVEATIALSIVLVAAEALHRRHTLARQWPALVAFLFGLVHGLGFAGALKDIGLPEHHLLTALLTFNLGVEAGQLTVVALAFVLFQATRYVPRLALLRVPALYAIGAVAAYWSIERVVQIVA